MARVPERHRDGLRLGERDQIVISDDLVQPRTIHSGKLTLNLKGDPLKMTVICKGPPFRFHVCFLEFEAAKVALIEYRAVRRKVAASYLVLQILVKTSAHLLVPRPESIDR